MPAGTTVVVHVVGLFLLSFQIEPGRLVAVAPRIPCPASRSADRTALMARTTERDVVHEPSAEDVMRAANVEEHAVTMDVPVSDYLTNNGWAPPAATGTHYIFRLDGERIRFIPSPLKFKPIRDQRVDDDNSNNLGLPHLGCCKDPQLRPEYLPSTNYHLAAAVLDFSGGRAHSCDQPFLRQDTDVDFDNGGTLTIEATKGTTTKQIVVKAGAHVTIQNMPAVANANNSDVREVATCSGGGGGDHRGAMQAMVKSCANRIPCPTNGRKGHDCSEPGPSIDARCSNNQWP